jgi:hypothetical protein
MERATFFHEVAYTVSCPVPGCGQEATETHSVHSGEVPPNPHFEGWRRMHGYLICPDHHCQIDHHLHGRPALVMPAEDDYWQYDEKP